MEEAVTVPTHSALTRSAARSRRASSYAGALEQLMAGLGPGALLPSERILAERFAVALDDRLGASWTVSRADGLAYRVER